MGKIKKKRIKTYQGSNATITRPSITRVSAQHRNAAQQWWLDNKRLAKPILIAIGVVILLAWLVFELFRLTGGR